MFGDIVKQLRKEKGLSQEELGKEFNISGPAVSKWESGQTEPDNITLIKVAIFFGVSTDYLLGKEKKQSQELREKEILKELLVKIGYMKPSEELTNEEVAKIMKFINANKEFIKENK